MLMSNLARVAVIVAGIAVCFYARGAIYTFLINLFQTCLVCLVLFLIVQCTLYFQRQHAQRRREIRLLKEQQTVTTTFGTDFVQDEDQKRSTKISSSPDFEENSSDYYENIKYKTVPHEEPETKKNEKDTTKEEPNRKRKEEDAIQKNFKPKKKEKDVIQEEPKTSKQEEYTRQQESKTKINEKDATQEEPRTEKKEEDTIQKEPTPMEKEEDTIQEEPTTMKKEEDTIHEEPTIMKKEEDTIQEEPTTMKKGEDTIHEEPTTMKKEGDTIHEEPTTMKKEEDTIHEEPTTMKKEEDTIQEELTKMEKEEDTMRKEPKTEKYVRDIIHEEPETAKTEEDTKQEEPKTTKKEVYTKQDDPKTEKKEVYTKQDEPKTEKKGEDTIQEQPKKEKKGEDMIQEEPTTMKKQTVTLQKEPKTREKEKYTKKAEPKTEKKDEDTEQDESKAKMQRELKKRKKRQKRNKVNLNKKKNDEGTKEEYVKGEVVIECKSESFLERLNLRQLYPNKLKLVDVMALRDSTNPLEISNIALQVAMKIIMINFNARDELLLQLTERLQEANTKSTFESSLDDFLCCYDDDDSMSINPLDLLLAIFKCSSPMLQQVLAVKLFKCKLAIPFLHPPFHNEPDLLTLWPLRSIMIECRTVMGSFDYTSVDCPCHVVSFIRLGRPSVSKSKLMNEIISDQYHNTFFNKDCSLGTSTKAVSEGMVEASWYLPSTNAPHFDNVTMFLNLRGDGKNVMACSHNLSRISNVIVVLLHIDELSEESSNAFIGSLVSTDSKICLAVDTGMYKREEITRKFKLSFQPFQDLKLQPKSIIVAMNGQMRSISAVKTDLRKTIAALANESHLKEMTLFERVKQYKGNVDEQQEIYVNAEHAARKVMSHIKSLETNVKRQVVPLQGKTWQTWSEKMKRSNKASLYKTIQEQGKLQHDMEEERRKQAKMCNNLSPAMSSFLKYLQQFVSCDNECLVFILFLKQMLDERSRNILPGYLSDFQTCWQNLKSARDKNEHSDVIKVLREKLDKSEQCLAEASFGFEHFCREMGQIYESLKYFPPQNKRLKQLSHILPDLTVQLLLMGLPFEIIDGDVANVPLVWVTAVLKRLKGTIGDKRLLTLSVLGIQSSGKSTLLNTMFGLQFAVSAGRCTRGVFMQLVPMTREKSLYDYLLVVDTEGLRAPELAHQKHSHDNELATFVIGLGDITIMNIKGENTAEMKDVLQIAVHASLRLKLANERLNLRQSCVFIHQNVPAFDANDKMMQGRQKFVEELDMMTKEAADQENIADIQSFNQVIEFDSEANVWYFSDLWRGDPPMAPANPGYSDKVSEVKESIVAGISKTRTTYLTITDTICRITDLWEGIVKDDFVFSFRNSLELKAYNSLEQMCQDVSWKLEKQVLEFGQTKARSRLVVCRSQTELETAVSQLFTDLRYEINLAVEKQIQDLDAFIDQNSLKDVMIQWVQHKRIRLKDNADILIVNAKKNINYVKDEILVRCKTTEEKTKHEMEINALAKSLAVRMEGQKPKEKDLQNQFNEMWNAWIKKFPSTHEFDVPIDMQIESTLCDKFPSDATFITKQKPLADQRFYHNLKKLEGSLTESNIHHNIHLSIHKKIMGTFWNEEKTHVCVSQTVDVMNTIFRQIDNIIQDLSTQDIQFAIAYVTEILTLVVTGIEDHNKHGNNDYKFNLLPSFRAMIINHVVSYAKVFFTKKNSDYNGRHSPKAQMEEYKGTAWILFKSTVQNKTDDVIAVGLFKEAIHKALVEHIDNLIPIDVSDHIFKYFGNGKHGLITEILVELANKENFDNYFKFIKDPYSYAENWLMKYIENKLFRTTTNRQTVYANLVETRSRNRFDEIEKCVNSTIKSPNANISDWIKHFVCDANESGELPLSEGMFVHVQNIPVKDIQAFVDLINEEMEGAKEDFLIPYKETTCSTIQWKESPLSRIMKTLWGCTELCMFCHEPCKEMSPGHWKRDNQPHTCVQHRPDGLNGFRYSRTTKMAVDFCNFSVGSDLTYTIGEHSGPYKDYKNHFPSWDIKPNANASDYWKWVACTFKENFMNKYDIEEPDIPENWWSITKQKAIDSLSSLS